MAQKKISVDEILLEVGLSASTGPEPGEPDIDRLLNDILAERQEKDAPLSNPAPASDEEPPTRVFRTGSLRRAVRPAAQQPAPPRPEPPFFKKAEEARSSPRPAPAKISLDIGDFSVDVDAIRAEQPPPKPIPAQELNAPLPEHQRPVDLLKKKPPRPPEEDRPADPFAPCFRRAGARIASEEPAMQEPLLRREARLSLLIGASVGAITLMILFLTIFIGFKREASPGFVPARLTLSVLTLLGAAAGALSWEMIGGGIWSLLRFRPDRNTLPAVGYLLCLLQSFGQLLFPKGLADPQIQIYLSAGTLLLCGGWIARAMAFRTAAVNAKFALSDYEKHVPRVVEDTRIAGEFTKGLTDGFGIPAVNCRTEQLDGFLSISLSSDRSDTAARNFALAGLILGGSAALFTFLFTQYKNLALTVMTAITAIFAPMSNWFSVVHPLRRESVLLNRLSALAAGERSIRDFSEVNTAVVDALDLIPPSSVTLNGIKTFAGMRIDEAILDAASVLIEAGSVLSDTFLGIIARRTELLRKVDAITYEDGKGLSGWIENRRILIGSRSLLAAHGIRAPSEDYERRFREEGSDLVYLATAGELTAVFVISLSPSPEVDNAIQILVDNDILLSVHTTDAFLTAERLSALYLCDRSCFKILPARLHDAFTEYRQPVKIKPAAIVNNGSVQSLAASLAAPRRMKVMISVSWVIQLVSVILGTALILMLTLLNALQQFSVLTLCGWLTGWLLLTLLAQKLVRSQ